MPTGREYANQAKKILDLKPKAGYIYGAMNKLWTANDQRALENKYNSDPAKYKALKYSAEYGSKWIGHRVWDCSGLTKDCGDKLGLNYHHGSNSSYRDDCEYHGATTKGMKLPVGAWVYTGSSADRGHIGIVWDDHTVIEAKGTKAGVVSSPLDFSRWTWWGLGRGLTFDFIPGVGSSVQNISSTKQTNTEKNPSATSSTSTKIPVYPTIRRGDRGEVVTQCQRLLAKDGSNLEIDGIFGVGTQSAVRAFQKRHNLTVDGIVGPQTWGALLKLV